jgi:Aminoglycoside 3-N-acetyltransferase
LSLFEAVSGLAVRYLRTERLAALRSSYLSARTKLHPVMRAAYGTFDAVRLREHLEQRIGGDFDILMVHSSVNNMRPMFTDSPLDFVRMLISFCGPARTLAMPAFYFGDQALGGAYATFKHQPRFDLRRTPSQMGLATELLRRSKGARQSRHPVYRVSALGPLAEALTHGHELAGTPCGRGTPFDFMANHETWIVGIGKPFEVLTQVHRAGRDRQWSEHDAGGRRGGDPIRPGSAPLAVAPQHVEAARYHGAGHIAGMDIPPCGDVRDSRR